MEEYSYPEEHYDCSNQKCFLCGECANYECENNPENKKTAEAAS